MDLWLKKIRVGKIGSLEAALSRWQIRVLGVGLGSARPEIVLIWLLIWFELLMVRIVLKLG